MRLLFAALALLPGPLSFDRSGTVYVAHPGNVTPAPLVRGTTPTNEYTPTWSPDGTRLAFAANPRGRYEIDMIRADGPAAAGSLVAAGSAEATSLSWSPSGRLIAFTSSARTPENQEATAPATARSGSCAPTARGSVDADGSGLCRLGLPGADPAWLPA